MDFNRIANVTDRCFLCIALRVHRMAYFNFSTICCFSIFISIVSVNSQQHKHTYWHISNDNDLVISFLKQRKTQRMDLKMSFSFSSRISSYSFVLVIRGGDFFFLLFFSNAKEKVYDVCVCFDLNWILIFFLSHLLNEWLTLANEFLYRVVYGEHEYWMLTELWCWRWYS